MLKKYSEKVEEENEKTWKSKLFGMSLSFSSAVMLLILNTIVQYKHLHFDDVLFVRVVLQTVFALFLLWINGESIWIKNVDIGNNICKIRIILFLYGFFGALFASTDLIAIYYMPLGDAMTIILSSVLPTMILAAIFLNERLRLYKISCAVLVISGLVLVIRPPFLFKNSSRLVICQNPNNLTQSIINKSCMEKLARSGQMNNSRSHYYYIGAIAALVCMISSATFRIMMKVLVQNKSTSSFSIPLFYSSIASLIAAAILPAFGGDQRILFPSTEVEKYDQWQWISLFVQAILGIAQYSARFMAIKLISPTMVSFIRTSEIVMAYIVQLTFFNTEPYLTSLIGSGLVMTACIGVMMESCVIAKLHPMIKDFF